MALKEVSLPHPVVNKTLIETACKLMLDKKTPHTSNNITNLKDLFVLLEITD
jgi:hypothetical protein